MYRLFRVKLLSQNYVQKLSRQNSVNSSQIRGTCLFCKQPSNNLSLPPLDPGYVSHSYLTHKRQNSSTSTQALRAVVKRKKRVYKKKNFSELLEVSDDKTSTRKASIKRLKAKEVAHIISQPEISLGELHKLQNNFETEQRNGFSSIPNDNNLISMPYLKNHTPSNEHFQSFEDLSVSFLSDNMTVGTNSVSLLHEIRDNYHDFITMDSLEELELEAQNDLHALEEISIDHKLSGNSFIAETGEQSEEYIDILDQIEQVSDKTPVKTKKSKKKMKAEKSLLKEIAKKKLDQLETAAKEDDLARSLRAYLDLCVTNNLLNRGMATLLHYRKRGKMKISPRVVDLRIYNIVMRGFAKKGNYAKVKELLTCLSEDQIPLSTQTFAFVFECLGRNPETPENSALLENCRSEAMSKGFTMNDIVDKSLFIEDERDVLISAIQRLEPEFKPIYTPPVLHYNGELIERLNSNRPPTFNTNLNTEEHHTFSAKDLQKFSQEQLNLEVDGVVVVKSIEKPPVSTEQMIHCKKQYEELQASWKKKICEAFQRDLQALKAQNNSVKSYQTVSIYPYLRVLEVSKYADIVLREGRRIAEGSETYSPTVGQLYRDLGIRVQARYLIEVKETNGVLNKVNEIYGLYCHQISNTYKRQEEMQDISSIEENKFSDFNTRQKWQMLVHQNNHGASTYMDENQWPMNVLMGVGRFLYNILMRDLKIDINCIRMNSKQQNRLPAFYTLFRNQGKFVKEEVKPHPVLSKLLRCSGQENLYFEPNTVPMLCPPVPWTTVKSGGYLVAKAEFVRLPYFAVQQWQRIDDTPLQQLYPSIDCLNQLSLIPWKVNTPVLDVILEVFNSGGSDKLDVPRPSSALKVPETITEPQNKQEKFNAFRQRMAIKRKQSEMYSLWCDTLYRLSLANHFRNRIFWLPHNMDFRGRVYPCPPHLNHLGSDLARSILIFGIGKPLGPNGLNWLKIHCINLTGLKKHNSVENRLAYANEVMDDILDSADNPLTGKQWWSKYDEPWQTLATCMEIANAVRSPDPEKYVSHFPIHQDGSCNGLQHYAALGRDSAGAYNVNLCPEDVPQDVYSAVAKLVEKTRASDAKKDMKIAKILEGHVKRKVIKQTVMTTVYGVTRFGARLQIARQLKDIDEFPKEFIWSASSYLTHKTFESLREMFTSTKEIQDWFTECARLISAVCGQHVEWITPLGLPVVQPYHKTFRKVDTSNNKVIGARAILDMFDQPNVMKQKNAFPPNFIHSLDSSHMMLTSLYCEHAGIIFVSVHDCFWTHACTVPIMNKICREQFVALHSQPILEDLSKFLVEKYSYSDRYFTNDGSVAEQTKKRLNNVLSKLPRRVATELEYNLIETLIEKNKVGFRQTEECLKFLVTTKIIYKKVYFMQ